MAHAELVFSPPRRAMPPRHLADLDEAGRIDAVTEVGLPAFRAKQLARHTSGADPRPSQMTDLPAAVRAESLPTRCSRAAYRGAEIECDAARPERRCGARSTGPLRVGADALPPAEHGVHLRPGGCGMACPFCATGQGGLTRNLSAAEIVEQVRRRRASRRDGCWAAPGAAVQRGVHGDGRAAGQLQPCAGRCAPHHRPAARTASASPRGRSRCRRSDWCPRSASSPTRHCGDAGAVAARTGRRAARHPGAGEHAVEGRRGAGCRAHYADVTGRRVSIEYALIRDVNDQPWRADLLGKRLHAALGPLVHVNVIPLNPTPGIAGTPARNPSSASSSGGCERKGCPARCATPAAAKSPRRAGSWQRKPSG